MLISRKDLGNKSEFPCLSHLGFGDKETLYLFYKQPKLHQKLLTEFNKFLLLLETMH